MFEVCLPIPQDEGFWRRHGTTELLESKQGQVPSTGSWYHDVHPRDALIEWMQEFTPSWAYYHVVHHNHTWGYHRRPHEILFAFAEARDAVLFKLTYA